MIKIAEKYDMQPNRVTDVARTSLIFETIGDLLVGLNFYLQSTAHAFQFLRIVSQVTLVIIRIVSQVVMSTSC